MPDELHLERARGLRRQAEYARHGGDGQARKDQGGDHGERNLDARVAVELSCFAPGAATELEHREDEGAFDQDEDDHGDPEGDVPQLIGFASDGPGRLQDVLRGVLGTCRQQKDNKQRERGHPGSPCGGLQQPHLLSIVSAGNGGEYN